jgi:hypothetical protein
MSIPGRRAYTGGLESLASWLTACGITTVATESTGVFGIPLYDGDEALAMLGGNGTG